MNKRKIEPAEYAGIIAKALQKGIFLTAKAGGKVNTMMIGWGTVGRIWNRPAFIAYVRTTRFTREMLDKNPEFTVNVPVNSYDKEALRVLGTLSGRDLDKIKELGLTLVEPEVISVPGIKEYPLTLECRVLYRQEQEADKLPEDIRGQFYSVETEDHVVYYGEIAAAYVIED